MTTFVGVSESDDEVSFRRPIPELDELEADDTETTGARARTLGGDVGEDSGEDIQVGIRKDAGRGASTGKSTRCNAGDPGSGRGSGAVMVQKDSGVVFEEVGVGAGATPVLRVGVQGRRAAAGGSEMDIGSAGGNIWREAGTPVLESGRRAVAPAGVHRSLERLGDNNGGMPDLQNGCGVAPGFGRLGVANPVEMTGASRAPDQGNGHYTSVEKGVAGPAGGLGLERSLDRLQALLEQRLSQWPETMPERSQMTPVAAFPGQDQAPVPVMPEGTRRFSRKPCVYVDRYDGTTPWTDYKAHFETCAELNGWDDIEKANFLAASLKGRAQQILSGWRREKGYGSFHANSLTFFPAHLRF